MKTRASIAILIILALLAVCPCLPARAGGAGTTAANFLKIPVAPLPSGMGEAYTAMAGPDSILYNPAGLGLLSYSAFSGAHNQYLDGIKQEYLAMAWRFPFGTVGAAFTTLSSGDIDAYDKDDMPIGKTSTGHRMVVFSCAQSWPRFKKDLGKLDPMLITPNWTRIKPVEDYRPKTYRLAAGASVKRISEKMDGESSSAYAFDAGLTLVLPHHFHAGVSALNFGASEKFVQEAYSLPSSMRFGLAKDFHTVNDIMVFVVASDLVKYSDSEYMAATGLEVDVLKMFQLRLGYKTQKDTGSRVSGGFGMNFDRLADKNSFMRGARMDYSYLDYGALGSTHRLGVQFIW
ncbi:MAG: hypothetical protein COX65_05900 [Elusimicrobia bacterium CG_4_10_14_0_2_um_filter_56_8]|nr:MAG: hypothetical protein AUJ51_04160 [Elusimicrobia bacterium CG1_02_56_21]PJA14283.1 MAG: hypothetical protein COX65_05900 [Elusimicrobia bacterium CG_4_10_14_0_2_um_filter_56_8]